MGFGGLFLLTYPITKVACSFRELQGRIAWLDEANRLVPLAFGL